MPSREKRVARLSVTGEPSWEIGECTDLAVSALNSRRLLPDREEAREAIASQMTTFRQRIQKVGESAIRFSPPFVTFDLSRNLSLTDFLCKKYGSSMPLGDWQSTKLLKEYGAESINERCTEFASPVKIGKFRKKLPIRILAMRLDGGMPHGQEEGLCYNGLDIDEQRRWVSNQKLLYDNAEHQGLATGVINVVDYIMYNTQLLEAGLKPLDRETFTRFPQMESKIRPGLGRDIVVPHASNGLALGFRNGGAWMDWGIRFSVGLAE